MSTPLIYHGSDLREAAVEQIGRKALNLVGLSGLAHKVPPFYVVPVGALESILPESSAYDAGGDPAGIAVEIREHIEHTSFSTRLREAIETTHAACFGDDAMVAVRSSSASEDGLTHSFAGLHDSVLGVQGTEGVLRAIKQVWMSSVSDRSIAYRQQHRLPPIDMTFAVIVQQMVSATRSGVCFTCDPMTGDRGRLVVSSTFGLGEGLVSGEFAADTYVIDRSTFAVEATLADKQKQMVLEDHVVQRVDVEGHDRESSSLTEDEVRAVAKIGLEIEAAHGRPQDIEFCYAEDGQLALLQTRPVTGLEGLQGQREPSTQSAVWDNSNIIESYSGVTTPMTFSFIRRAYSIVYHCFAEVMGISPRVVDQHRDAFENMLGFFHGRVYYNLKNWYRLVRMFPGYNYNSRAMESMMGVKQSLVLDEETPKVGAIRRWFVELPALMTLLARSGWNFLRIRKTVEQFERHFYGHYEPWSKIDFDEISPHEIKQLYDMMEKEMLWNWKAPIINDFYVMVFYGVLRKMCIAWCGDEHASLQNGLVCGEGGLQSDEPARLLMRMTQLANEDPALRGKILDGPVESLPERIGNDQQFEAFNRLMTQYLDEFGLRCANELKLESFSYNDEPHRVYQIVRSYLTASAGAACDAHQIEQREQNIREEAERLAHEKLAHARSWMPRKMLFHWVLRNTRQGIRNRENMRFARTRIYGILRKMLRSIGQHFEREGVLEDREDIFYLTIDEVWDYIKGTAVTTDLRGLARFRKSEYDRYREEGDPNGDRFETFGLPYRAAQRIETVGGESGMDQPLSGLACCPGVVTGIAHVVRDPAVETEFKGGILVAERTDPGWVPFYPAFSGILVERGSVLSHSAIVAREMGIPTIVGIPELTRRVASGQRIRMNGGDGSIELLAGSAADATTTSQVAIERAL